MLEWIYPQGIEGKEEAEPQTQVDHGVESTVDFSLKDVTAWSLFDDCTKRKSPLLLEICNDIMAQ